MAPPTVSELSETELAVWRGFLRLHAALAKQLDAELEAAHGLPLSSYEVLINLQAAPDQRLRMADLADRALLSRSGMTRLVDRLERQGLLARDHCVSDARGCFAVLTDAGRELLARARPTHLAGVREKFLQHLEPGDFERLAALWEAMMPGVTAPTQKT
jgi:DNA-binding MarR family transcriptional regulator